MPSAVQEVVEILDLEPLEVNLFRGRSPQSRWQRVFGGQVIGQALVAACRTVDDVATRPPHSLHAYFLLGGDPKVPIIYEVDRIRDGKSFTTRSVKAIQHGRAIFSMSVSFHVAEPGLTHQAKMPDVPKPEALPNDSELKERIFPLLPESARRYYERERPIEFRPVEFSRYLGEKSADGRFDVWIRATGRLNKLYVELLKDNPEWGTAGRRHDMNHFMARLIFCFFAEDTDIFNGIGLFTATIEQMSARDSSGGQ